MVTPEARSRERLMKVSNSTWLEVLIWEAQLINKEHSVSRRYQPRTSSHQVMRSSQCAAYTPARYDMTDGISQRAHYDRNRGNHAQLPEQGMYKT